jgi:hypothetical protein
MPAVISKTVLVLAEGFPEGIDAARVGRALARGLEDRERDDGERLRCDVCALTDAPSPSRPGASRAQAAGAPLDELGFDERLRAARALVIAHPHLDHRALGGSVAFEAATRARQTGVPAYAVTACDELDPFEARIMDLQVVIEAPTTRALRAAGRRLAGLV